MTNSPMMMLWVERYRPTSLDQLALTEEHRSILQAFLTAGEIPHLIFGGPPGCGKTTVAKILIQALDCAVLSLNASKDRGIDVVRDRVGMFSKVYMAAKWKVVFLDEADGMTADAQNSLRSLMEDYYDQTRFIFTANYLHKIISPIQSRCTVFQFGETPLKERIQILQHVLTAEKIAFDLHDVLSYAEFYTDLRRMIMAAQKSVIANGGVLKPASESQVSGNLLVGLVRKGIPGWDELVKISSDPSFDHRQALKSMFWAVDGGVPSPAKWRFTLAKAIHEGMWTPDAVVHFLGTCAELMES